MDSQALISPLQILPVAIENGKENLKNYNVCRQFGKSCRQVLFMPSGGLSNH